jgi:hypothetical protein
VRALLFAALLISSAAAQTPSGAEKVIDVKDFRDCGFISRFSPDILKPNCLQQATNVLFDKTGVMLRRNGYSKYNLTACTGSKPIRGLWPFFATDGSQYLVAYSSGAMFYSKGDGTCSEITGLGGLSPTAEMECVQSLGYLNCTNGTDTPFRTNVTSTQTLSAAPVGKHIGAFRNRLLMSGVGGSLTRVYASGELDGTDWGVSSFPTYSTSAVQLDVAGLNDGQGVTCLLGEFQNQFLIGRLNDLYSLAGYDNRDFVLRKLSSQVGCIDPKSVQEVNNQLLWLSNRGVEGFSGTEIQRVSYPIDPTISLIIQSAGNARSQTFTTQADWQLGQLTPNPSGPGAPISATISAGNIVPSTWGVSTVGLSNTDWEMADVDTTTAVTNYISNFDGGSTTRWTFLVGTWSSSGDRLTASSAAMQGCGSVGDGETYAYTTNSASTGTWSFVYTSSRALSEFIVFVTSDTADRTVATVNSLQLNLSCTLQSFSHSYSTGSVTSFLPQTTTADICDGASHVIRITRSQTGQMKSFVDGVAAASGVDVTDMSVSRGLFGIFSSGSSSPCGNLGYSAAAHYDKIILPAFYENQVSSIYDTGLSTPVYGAYVVAMSSLTTSSVTFSVQTSRVGDGTGFSTLASQTNSSLFAGTMGRRYFRDHIYASPPESATVSSVTARSLTAATSAYYVTACVTANGMSSWGNTDINAVTGGGSFTFQQATGTSCGNAIASTATWNTITANAIPAIPVSSFTAVRVLFTIDSATQVTTGGMAVNDITLNWNEGSARPPVSSSRYDDRYYLFFTSSTASTAKNDHAVVYDQNKKWSLFDDVYAYSATLYLNKLYTGDSTASGTIFQQDSGDDDNSSAYTMTFQTADLDGEDPSMLKAFSRAYLLLGAPDSTTSGAVLNCLYSLDGSSSTYSLGSVTLSESPETSGYFVAKMPFPLGSPSTGHWINLQCSYTGSNGPVSVHEIKLVYAPLAWE